MKESEDEEPVYEEIPSSPEPEDLKLPEKDVGLASGSFDCNDRDASETNSPTRAKSLFPQQAMPEITPRKVENPDDDDGS